jgi:preprotein translocase subunit SecA
MNDLISYFNILSQRVFNGFLDSNSSVINKKMIEKYSLLSRDEIQLECLKCIRNDFELKPSKSTISDYFFGVLKKLSLGNKVDEFDLNLIALASEAFKREPADLPPRSFLYESQLRAATALSQNCLVQIDTGEGKTYALLPAAFMLAVKYHRVYILCANEYLARRDSERTRNYWDFVGLSSDFALETNTEKTFETERWNCRVIYTTLTSMLFKQLNDDTAAVKPEYPVTFGAVLFDEADAILLDQIGSTHVQSIPVKSNIFDWSLAIRLAKELQMEEHINIYKLEREASLTDEGENYIRNQLKILGMDFTKYQLVRKAVEISYVSLFVVEGGKDYVEKSGRLHPSDNKTGEILFNQTRDWLIPLEYSKNLRARSKKITRHEILPSIFLNKFDHKSGVSGTLDTDVIEYLFSYSLPTIVIPPEKKRYKGLKNDVVYASKREAFLSIIDYVKEFAIVKRQPLLIGCQNTDLVEKIYQSLIKLPVYRELNINAVSWGDNEKAAEIFKACGNVGFVTVATQLGGRGVDIRLSEEALNNGGLALICIEHSNQQRHDRQFLGRAGRQGQKYTAFFIASLEDHLLQLFGSERIKKLMDVMGLQEGEVISHSMITNSILRA